MRTGVIGDPRLQELFGAADAAGARPIVRLPRGGPSGWKIAVVAGLAALLLFWALETRPRKQSVPEVRQRGTAALRYSIESPPLYIPPTSPRPLSLETQAVRTIVPLEGQQHRQLPPLPPPIVYQRPLAQQPPSPMIHPSRSSGGSALVVDTSMQSSSVQGPAVRTIAPGVQTQWGARARAGALANPSTTVVQGVLIPAVLETAFNSTTAGLARAIVSRDVRGFDGARVLIPRGSRLIGEYQADVDRGQNRALITWTRLICPDGTTMALNSPAIDRLGRAGVRASVDTHFWERFGDALLRTTVNVGGAIAARAVTGGLLVAVPGSGPQSTNPDQRGKIVPTLTVAAGSSISVFVARDLEFPNGPTE